ncbi:EAL and HDOD domain-containing protein [Pseudothauera rhizosphaerae]|uniref:HDOD domain-containing protein n=1 Tax=Pseudothauera rhizosphaerae TaxID=2565932 RepID=A0A4S4AVR4_9RHOO|nr:HDOD domain-containing protein [Pseudothauera rhizosphaerae]THF62636.1 HDOD domain-containing protein [Pseudothauera rhizosphaerae]
MFTTLLGRHRPSAHPGKKIGAAATGFAMPDRRAPRTAPRDTSTHLPLMDAALRPVTEATPETHLCRETILSRDQHIAAYQFMLREGTRNRIRSSGLHIRHAYTELLVRNVAQIAAGQLPGQRLVFVAVPDSFLGHPSLELLPRDRTVLTLEHAGDTEPAFAAAVPEHLTRLRQAGIRIALPAPESEPAFAALQDLADVIVLDAGELDAESGLRLADRIRAEAPQAALLVRNLAGPEDFRFLHALGASYFQGSFITRRENWSDRELPPNAARLADLIARLRNDGDTSEITALIKQDAALTVRLLRYINSAANGLPNPVSSIEHAFMLLGRGALQRWLTMLLCSSGSGRGRVPAVLETALARARMMEQLAERKNPAVREALFLTGLLSLIDIILQVSLERAMTSLAVDPAIQAAVLRGEGPYAAALELALACESDDALRIRQAAGRCALSPERATSLHFEALAWAWAVQN